MYRAIRGVALVVLVSPGAWAQSAAAPKPKAAESKPAAIPVDAATRKKIQDVFVKHEATLVAFDEARSALRSALIAGAGIQSAGATFDRRKVELADAQKAIKADLDRAGIKPPVQDQEWKAWLAARDAAKAAAPKP